MDYDFSLNEQNVPTYPNSGNLLTDARHIIDASRNTAYRAINVVMLQRNWKLGKRIHEEILRGKDRADYGAEVVKNLSKNLTEIYGKGFNKNNLYAFVSFYKIFPTLSGKSELKTTQISHQDVGQMDMYVRMYDSLKRTEGDNPTIGLILCSKTSADMARYSILKENKQLFQAKYLTFLPTEEQLRQEIEQQKEMFLMQQNENNRKKEDNACANSMI